MNYRARVGESSVTGSFWKAWKLGLRMIFLVLEYRFGFAGAGRPQWREAAVPLPRARREEVHSIEDLAALAREIRERSETPSHVSKP